MHCDGVPFLSLKLSPSLLARGSFAALCPGALPLDPAEGQCPSDSPDLWGTGLQSGETMGKISREASSSAR